MAVKKYNNGVTRKSRAPRTLIVKDEEYFKQEEVFTEELLRQFRDLLMAMYESNTSLSLELLYDFAQCYNSGDIEDLTAKIKDEAYKEVFNI